MLGYIYIIQGVRKTMFTETVLKISAELLLLMEHTEAIPEIQGSALNATILAQTVPILMLFQLRVHPKPYMLAFPDTRESHP